MSGKLKGKVVEINDSGDLVTDIAVSDLEQAPRDNSLKIQVDEHETFGLYPAEHQQPSMTLVAIAGEDGPVKITLVDDSATAMLGVQVGAEVKIAW